MAAYTFSHFVRNEGMSPYPETSSTQKTVYFNDEEMDPWTAVLAEFTTFLSGVYGYDISKQVFVEHFGEDSPVPLNEVNC